MRWIKIISWIKLIFGLVVRNILPASVGKGWRRFVPKLPSIGIVLIVLVLSIIGMSVLLSRQDITLRIANVKDSPYMALLGEGTLHVIPDHSSQNIPRVFDSNPSLTFSFWNKVRLVEVPEFSQKKNYYNQRLFDKVIPFEWAYLDFTKMDGNVRPSRWGMALHFPTATDAIKGSGNDDNQLIDFKFLDEVRNNLLGDKDLPFSEEPAIIISKAVLEKFGYKKLRGEFFIKVSRGKNNLL